MRRIAAVIATALLTLTNASNAQVETEKKPIPLTAEQDLRFKELLPDLRCLVCQNESLAESTAPLAQDLKYEVRGLVAQGKDEKEIKKYLTDRYGDFVLFRPPFDPRTALLWFGPLLLVFIGVITLVIHVRGTRRRHSPAATVDADALRKLLEEKP